jgi:hypothetical protein
METKIANKHPQEEEEEEEEEEEGNDKNSSKYSRTCHKS